MHAGFEWSSNKDVLAETFMVYFMEEAVVETHGHRYASDFASYGDFDEQNRPLRAKIGAP